MLQTGIADQPRGQYEGVVIDCLQHHRGAAVEEAKATMDGRRLLEFPIRDTAHRTSDGHWSAVTVVRLATHLQGDGRANPCRDTCRDRLRIAQRLQVTPHTESLRNLEQDGRVGWTAAANVVADVHQYDRSFWRSHRGPQRRFGRRRIGHELCALVPGAPGHPARCLARGGLVAIADGQEGHAHLGHVSVWIAFRHAGREHPGAPDNLFRIAHQAQHRLLAGELLDDVDHDRALNGAHDDVGALQAARSGIQVRISAVHHRRGGVVDHLLGQIGVHVGRHSDRHVWSDQRTDSCCDFAIHIRIIVRYGGAVLSEQHTVPRPLVAQHLQHLAADPLEGIRGNRTGGIGEREQQRHHLDAELFSGVEEAGHRGVRRRVVAHDLVAAEYAALNERRVVSAILGERVGLVRHAQRC